MHQTKRVAVSSAQTFLQPSAPIKSVRHPAIAARPHQPQHAPADPDTTHLLDPNSGPTAAPADDTRHRFRSRPVPAAPARTGSEHPPRARRRRRAQPRRWPALRSAADIRTEDPAPRFAATRKHPHSAAARKHPALGPQRSNRADCSGCSGRTDRSCRPLRAFFPQATPTAQSRRPAVRKHPRARGCLPLKAASHPGSHFHPPGPRKRNTRPVNIAPLPLGSPRGNPAQVPTAVRNTARSTAPPPARTPQTQHDAC